MGGGACWAAVHIRYGDCSVRSLSHVRLFVTPWTAARQASLSITNSRNLLRLMSVKSVMPSNYLILCRPFSSCLQSFPRFFPMSQFFTPGGQSVGASASVQFSSIAQSCPILCDPMDCSMPGLPVHCQLLEFAQTHVH